MGRLVDAKMDIVVDRDQLMRIRNSVVKEVSRDQLADAIHEVFCQTQAGFRGLTGLQADIHRRQHLEIAQAIFDKLP